MVKEMLSRRGDEWGKQTAGAANGNPRPIASFIACCTGVSIQ